MFFNVTKLMQVNIVVRRKLLMEELFRFIQMWHRSNYYWMFFLTSLMAFTGD